MPRSELLGTVTVGQKPTHLPQIHRAVVIVRIPLDATGSELDDLVEERIGVDEEDVPPHVREVRHEMGGATEADQGFIGVDYGHPVTRPVGVLLEMVLGRATAEMCAGVQKLLDYCRVDRHPSSEMLPDVSERERCLGFKRNSQSS